MNCKLFLSFLMAGVLPSCTKYLDKLPDSTQEVPRHVSDLRNILNNDQMTNNSTPGVQLVATDDYNLGYNAWLGADMVSRNVYVWVADPYPGESLPAWNNAYENINSANVVLGALDKVQVEDPIEYKAVHGSALFYRAFFFYSLEEVFGQPWRPGSAATDLGIILRLDADPTKNPGRSPVQNVYRQILDDLLQSVSLLPRLPDPVKKNLPSAAAAYALLARTCLTMQDYVLAGSYADSSLALYDRLIDYNTLDTNSPRPFSLASNDEVLFQCSAQAYQSQFVSTSSVDGVLYNSYASDDLRKYLFFRMNNSLGAPYFKGQYTGLLYLFSGLSTDEVYITRAECRARTGDVDGALQDLNSLLSRRWKTGRFIPYTGLGPDAALDLILLERRKETLFRDLRWVDLRRLNQDSKFARTLTRVLNGKTYTLPPGDLRYAFLIPDDEVRMSQIRQNPR